MVKTLAKPTVKARDRGNAAWCVRKHCGGALRHTTETNQKLGRNYNDKTDMIKLDKPTKDEANAIIYDIDQIEYHIQNEVLPQVKNIRTKQKLRRIDKKAREIRQRVAQTGVIFYDNKEVDGDTMRVMEKATGDLKKLVAEIDNTASFIMKQEQIECENCVEDLIGPEGLKDMRKRVKPTQVKKPLFDFSGIKLPKIEFPKIDLSGLFGGDNISASEKAWRTRRERYGSNGMKPIPRTKKKQRVKAKGKKRK